MESKQSKGKIKKSDKKRKNNPQDQLIELQDFQNGQPKPNPNSQFNYQELKMQIEAFNRKCEQQEPLYERIKYPDQKKVEQKVQYILPGNKQVDSKAVQYGKVKQKKVSSKNQKVSENKAAERIIENRKKMQNRNNRPKKSPVPQMMVACDSCTLQQYVPGNTQVYSCYCCSNLNQCYPLYGIFVCGKCNSKICYPFSTSQMIKCTKCNTVNKVPIQPTRRYIGDLSQQPYIQNPHIQTKFDTANDFFNQGQQFSDNRQKIDKSSIIFQDGEMKDEKIFYK